MKRSLGKAFSDFAQKSLKSPPRLAFSDFKWYFTTGLLENKAVLETALRRAASENEATLRSQDQYGDHYNIRFSMETPVGESWILSCWIVRKGEAFPRLTNTYPVRS